MQTSHWVQVNASVLWLHSDLHSSWLVPFTSFALKWGSWDGMEDEELACDKGSPLAGWPWSSPCGRCRGQEQQRVGPAVHFLLLYLWSLVVAMGAQKDDKCKRRVSARRDSSGTHRQGAPRLRAVTTAAFSTAPSSSSFLPSLFNNVLTPLQSRNQVFLTYLGLLRNSYLRRLGP